MFLEAITLTQTTPCLAEPGRIIVTGKPSCILDDVLPYLATLPNVIGFNPEALTLTLRRQPGFITIYRQRITITQVKDVDEGLALLEALKDAINATWEHRHELTPVMKPQKPPRPLDVYAILPQTNCRECGQPTCMAFAVNLLTGKTTLDRCQPLQDNPAFIERKTALEAML
ncbi:MAG: (Fe-S)-binding protein [Anaerolineales bacterium]